MQTSLFDEADTGLLEPNMDFEKKKEDKENNK